MENNKTKMAVNVKSILTSGFIAGIIINISAITMVPVVGNEMDAVLTNLGLSPLSNAAMGYFCFISLVFGVFLMYLYAFVKPQFQSRIKAAIIVSIIIWVLAYLSSNVALAVYGFMPVRLVVIGSIWGLMELLLASIVGSRLYDKMNQYEKG
jgi:hypothetical protein